MCKRDPKTFLVEVPNATQLDILSTKINGEDVQLLKVTTGRAFNLPTSPNYVNGDGNTVLAADVTVITLQSAYKQTYEVDANQTLTDSSGDTYAAIKPVGSVPNPCNR